MALNQKGWITLKKAWLAIVSFAVYPLLDNIAVTIFLAGSTTSVVISAYLPSGELIGTIVAFSLLLPGLNKLTKTTYQKEKRNMRLVSYFLIEQGILTALGNVFYIWSQRLTSPVIVVVMSTVPMLASVAWDIRIGEEKGGKIVFQLLLSLLPIAVTIAQTWPITFSNQLLLPVGLLFLRSILIVRVEYTEKKLARQGFNTTWLYAWRQLVTFLFSLGVGYCVAMYFGQLSQAIGIFIYCLTNPQIIGILIAVMVLSTIAGSWKIWAKGASSVSGTLILLNTQVTISIVATLLTYWILEVNTSINPLLAIVTVLSTSILVGNMLIEVQRYKASKS